MPKVSRRKKPRGRMLNISKSKTCLSLRATVALTVVTEIWPGQVGGDNEVGAHMAPPVLLFVDVEILSH